jgi:hypothetical protein
VQLLDEDPSLNFDIIEYEELKKIHNRLLSKNRIKEARNTDSVHLPLETKNPATLCTNGF